MAKGVYIHIPFCRSVCSYCDFPKLAGARERIPEYVHALVREIAHHADELGDVETVYIGGGTPSAIGTEALEILFGDLNARLDFSQILEFTIEANPSDVTFEWASFLAQNHVTRVSLGVETAHPHLLKRLNREGNASIVAWAVGNLREAGIPDLNLDFIYAIPGETMTELDSDIGFAVSLCPDHLSFYSLILEEKTQMMYDVKARILTPCDLDLEADMYEKVLDELPRRGYPRYEIANFAHPGHESKHNLLYWNVQPYLGIGMGAHSQTGRIRYHNHATLQKYLDAVRKQGSGLEAFDPCNLAQETGLLGFRKAEGLSLKSFQERFGAPILSRYPGLRKNIAEGLLEVVGDHLRLTHKGVMVLNYVERSFLEEGQDA